MNNTPLPSKESKAFLKKVNTLLKTTGMTKAELARIGTVKDSTFRMWLLGKNRVTVEGRENFEKGITDFLMDLYQDTNAFENFLGPREPVLDSI